MAQPPWPPLPNLADFASFMAAAQEHSKGIRNQNFPFPPPPPIPPPPLSHNMSFPTSSQSGHGTNTSPPNDSSFNLPVTQTWPRLSNPSSMPSNIPGLNMSPSFMPASSFTPPDVLPLPSSNVIVQGQPATSSRPSGPLPLPLDRPLHTTSSDLNTAVSTTDREEGEVSDSEPVTSEAKNRHVIHGNDSNSTLGSQRKMVRQGLSPNVRGSQNKGVASKSGRKAGKNRNVGRTFDNRQQDNNNSYDNLQHATSSSGLSRSVHDNYRPDKAVSPKIGSQNNDPHHEGAGPGPLISDAPDQKRNQTINGVLSFNSNSGVLGSTPFTRSEITQSQVSKLRTDARRFITLMHEHGFSFNELSNEQLDADLLKSLYDEQNLSLPPLLSVTKQGMGRNIRSLDPKPSKASQIPPQHLPSNSSRPNAQTTQILSLPHHMKSQLSSAKIAGDQKSRLPTSNEASIALESQETDRAVGTHSFGKHQSRMTPQEDPALADRKQYLARLMAMKSKKSDLDGIGTSSAVPTATSPSSPSSTPKIRSLPSPAANGLETAPLKTSQHTSNVSSTNHRQKELERLRKEALQSAKAANSSRSQNIGFRKADTANSTKPTEDHSALPFVISKHIPSSPKVSKGKSVQNSQDDAISPPRIHAPPPIETPLLNISMEQPNSTSSLADIPGLSLTAPGSTFGSYTLLNQKAPIEQERSRPANQSSSTVRKRPVASDFDETSDLHQVKRQFGRSRFDDDTDQCIIEASDDEKSSVNDERPVRLSDEEVDRILEESKVHPSDSLLSLQDRQKPFQYHRPLANTPQTLSRASSTGMPNLDDLNLRERKILEMKKKIELIEQRKKIKLQSLKGSDASSTASSKINSAQPHYGASTVKAPATEISTEPNTETLAMNHFTETVRPDGSSANMRIDGQSKSLEVEQSKASEESSRLEALRAQKEAIEKQLRQEEDRLVQKNTSIESPNPRLEQTFGAGELSQGKHGHSPSSALVARSPLKKISPDVSRQVTPSMGNQEDDSQRSRELSASESGDTHSNKSISAPDSNSVGAEASTKEKDRDITAATSDTEIQVDDNSNLEYAIEQRSDFHPVVRDGGSNSHGFSEPDQSSSGVSDDAEMDLDDQDTEEGEIRSTSSAGILSSASNREPEQSPTAEVNSALSQNIPSKRAPTFDRQTKASPTLGVIDVESDEDYEPPEAADPSGQAKERENVVLNEALDGSTMNTTFGSTDADLRADVALEVQAANDLDTKEDHVLQASVEQDYFTPYESPLKMFKSYRFHPNFLNTVPSGYRSLTYSHTIDPNMGTCPFELAGGICNDSACPWQHFRSMPLKDEGIFIELGTSNPGRTEDEKRSYSKGLSELLKTIRDSGRGQLDSVVEAIANFRRDFFHDPTLVLDLQVPR